ncbi:MAG: TonB system transport protein ExbD [Cardiobacteriaceae bacterium]|nr:TonB system transport protein ExbD [Cardiobacteriaceae bacterium]
MKKFDSINVIPFIDIMLVLLAIILMTASFIAQGKITVNTPHSKTTQTIQPDPQNPPKMITIDQKGVWYLDDVEVSQSALEAEVMKWNEETVVHLKIDSQAAFEQFVQVGDILREQKIRKVHLMALPDKSASQSALSTEMSQLEASYGK